MSQQPSMLDFIGPSYTLQGNSMACRESINIALQSGEGLTKYEKILVGTPGTRELIDLTTEVGSSEVACRGLWLTGTGPYNGGNLYWVYGSKIGYTYKDEFGGTDAYKSKVLYDIGLDTARVSLTDDGFSVTVATGTNMYVISIWDDSVVDVTATLPFKLPKQVVYMFGRTYCICGDQTPQAKQDLSQAAKANLVWYSEPNDSKTWNALSFVGADLSADPIQAIVVRQGDLWAFGPRSYQIFATTEDPEAPLAYAPGSGNYIGINAPATAYTIADNCFWLGSNAAGINTVFRSSSYNAVRVSNYGIENKLKELGDLTAQAFGFAYQEAGHVFYCLTVPAGFYEFEGATKWSDGITLVYDLATEQWHQRSSREPKTGKMQAWQPLFAVWAWGKILVGNLLWPTIMELRSDVYTDYDPTTATKRKPIMRQYQGPVMYDNLQEFILEEFQWDIVAGHAPLNGLSKSPVAMIQVSYDSGNTWGNLKRVSMGKTGQYAWRINRLRMGASRGMVIRVIVTEDLQFMAGQARIRTTTSRLP